MKAQRKTWMASVAIAAAIAVPGSLSAQDDQCKINDSSPWQINGAKQYVITAASSRKEDEIPKHLANAVRVLTDNVSKINNEPGRQWLLLRAYAQWLQRGETGYVMKRGDVGFTTDKDGDHNLLLAVDSAATSLERLMPECVEKVRPYRQRFFSDILNKSIEAMNADQNDSSIYFAKLSLLVAGKDPRPWNVLSAVYQKNNDLEGTVTAMEKVIELSGNDTLYAKIKQQSRYNLAVIKLQNAEAAPGENKDKNVAQARTLLEEFLKDEPGDASATQALGRAMRLAGDTAAVAQVFADMMDRSESFTADQLFEAASNAAGAGQDTNAVKLFENGLKKNPYHRLALLNMSNVLFQMRDFERMGPIAERLTTVDPNNPDSWRMLAGYWQLRQRSEQDAAKKKAYGDSTLAAITKRDAVNPKITVFLASPTAAGYQLQGNLGNESNAAASYTVKFELLDATGAVVTTKDVAVGPVDAHASTTFSLTVEGAGIVAYRYAPVK
jgi:hypothetical protein